MVCHQQPPEECLFSVGHLFLGGKIANKLWAGPGSAEDEGGPNLNPLPCLDIRPWLLSFLLGKGMLGMGSSSWYSGVLSRHILYSVN